MRYIYILFFLLLFCSCEKEPSAVYTNDNYLVFTVKSETSVVQTKSSEANELLLHNGYIFFFTDKGEYIGNKQLDVSAIEKNGSSSFTVLIDEAGYKNGTKIIGVFNYDEDNYVSDFTGMDSENVTSYFPISASYLEDLRSNMNAGLVGMPMCCNDFTDTDNTVHELYRSVAKLNISIKEGLLLSHEDHVHAIEPTDFAFAFVNVATGGSVVSSSEGGAIAALEQKSSVAYSAEELEGLDFKYVPSSYDSSTAIAESEKIYMQEFAYSTAAVDGGEALEADVFSIRRFAIMLAHFDDYSGETLYYKMNLADKLLNKYFDVNRNHDYSIIITAIDSRGYTTMEEAYYMPPSNIEYEVYDNTGETTMSNGQYAISMDEVLNYDNIQVYGHETTTIEFNNIKYIMPSEMSTVDMEKMTNEISFEIISEGTLEVTVVENGFDLVDGVGVLDSTPRSIVLDVTGEGEAVIKLYIKLGNLEAGREAITINKVGENSAFDAHPSQLYLANQVIEENSWNSLDLDFGARYDAEYENLDGSVGATLIYMGDNAVPVGYKTMDGYVSGSSSDDSYPIFAEKSRTGYYTYTDRNGENKKTTKIMLTQLDPYYLGHFGSLASEGSPTHYNPLVCEKIEEIPIYEWDGSVSSTTGGVLAWSDMSSGVTQAYYGAASIYNTETARYLNLVEGREVTKYLAETYGAALPAAYYCYMKNDVNANGVIDADEPINWYLPAQNQALAMWVHKIVFDEGHTDYDFDMSSNEVSYWTCSEFDPSETGEVPSSFTHAIKMNMIEGETITDGQTNASWTTAHVRCVRGVVKE